MIALTKSFPFIDLIFFFFSKSFPFFFFKGGVFSSGFGLCFHVSLSVFPVITFSHLYQQRASWDKI